MKASKKKRRVTEGRSNSHEKAKKQGGNFIADAYTRDLKQGKQPPKVEPDHIARYGKGFSNLIQMAVAHDRQSASSQIKHRNGSVQR